MTGLKKYVKVEYDADSVIPHNLPDISTSFDPPGGLDKDLGRVWSDIKSRFDDRAKEGLKSIKEIQIKRDENRKSESEHCEARKRNRNYRGYT